MPAVIPFIPLIVGGLATAGTVYAAKKQSSAAEKALAEQQREAQSTESIAGRQQQQAEKEFSMGSPGVQQSQSYYGKLLNGDRAQLANATAAPRNSILDSYRGAEQGLTRSGVQGGARDTAIAELQRDKAGKVAGLTTGVQPAAANALGSQGLSLISGGQQGLSSAGSLFGNLTQLAGQNSRYQQGLAADSQQQAGRSIFGLLTTLADKYGKNNSGSLSSFGPYASGYKGGNFGNEGYNSAPPPSLAKPEGDATPWEGYS